MPTCSATSRALPAEERRPLFLQRISAAGRALHRLVESVLEYARLDRGRNVLIPPASRPTICCASCSELCNDVRGSNELTCASRPRRHAFTTDYDRLYSVLSNLLLNAIKFTADGERRADLRRLGHDAEFTFATPASASTPEELPHVFEPFRQVDGSPTRTYGGVGLGLAIVRRNVELLGGSVQSRVRSASAPLSASASRSPSRRRPIAGTSARPDSPRRLHGATLTLIAPPPLSAAVSKARWISSSASGG